MRSPEAARDTAAFEAVYREAHQDLYRYARSIVRDEHAAEDVLQSTMERALVALQKESRDFELRPWLFRVAHNEAISRIRRDKPTDELPETVPTAEAPVAEQFDQKQTLDQLWLDLATLPERQRQALVLRELNGLGHDEIGEVIGTSGRAVKQTIFEARRALLDCSEGRAMLCDDVQRVLSDGDGRTKRARRLQSHVRSCRDCRAFDAALSERPEQLRVLAPVLPLAAATALFGQLAPGASGALLSQVGGASAGWSLGSLGGALATKAAIVGVASVAAAGAAGVAAVEDRDAGRNTPARGSSTAPANGALAAGIGAGAVGAGGSGILTPLAPSRTDRTGASSAGASAPSTPSAVGNSGGSVAPAGQRDAPQGAAGKARAAANRAAAADRRAAARAKSKGNGATNASGAGRGNSGSSSTKPSGASPGPRANQPATAPAKTPAKGRADSAPNVPVAPAPAPPAPAPPEPTADAGKGDAAAGRAPGTPPAGGKPK